MGRGLFRAGARYRFIVLSGHELAMRYPDRSIFPYAFIYKQSQQRPGFDCFIARALGCCHGHICGPLCLCLSPSQQWPGFIVFSFFSLYLID
jgi:hypothetical protein